MWYVGRMVGFGAVVAVLLAAAPEGVFAQKKKKDADTQYPAATEADYAALKSTLFPAKIVTLDVGKTVTVRTEYSKKESNPNYKPPVTTPGQPGYNAQAAQLQKKLTDLQNQMQRSVNAKNAAQIQANINRDMATIQVQLAKLNNDPNNQPLITVNYTKDYDFDFEKKVVYRKMFLPMENDSDGNPKKFTAEEKLVLRGPTQSPPLPGYIAKSDELQEGQEVKLYLTLPKKKAKTDDDTTPPEHATIKMIVVTKRAGDTADADTKKK